MDDKELRAAADALKTATTALGDREVLTLDTLSDPDGARLYSEYIQAFRHMFAVAISHRSSQMLESGVIPKDFDRSNQRAGQLVHAISMTLEYPCGALVPYPAVVRALGSKWFQDDGAAPLSNATKNRHVAAFSALMRHLLRYGIVDRVPEYPYATETGARTDFLSREEWARLEFALRPNAKIAARFLLQTAMRLSEAWRCWFDLDNNNAILSDTKNGQRRVVPVDPELAIEFQTTRATYAKRDFQRDFAEAVGRILPGRDLVVHSLRHTAASWLMQQNVPLVVVADILGHKSLNTTRRYSHLSTTQKSAVLGLLR